MQKNAFTVDLEDGLSIAMRDQFGMKIPVTERVQKSAQMILTLLNKYQTKATFFCVGQVAKRFPALIKEIRGQGHEIGAHGNEHLPYWKLSKEDVYSEIKECKDTIEQVLGEKISGHRAPLFSINTKNTWALDIIADLGFKYDSSIVPIKPVAYNGQQITTSIQKIKTTGDLEIIEFPISTLRFLGKEFPFCGGSYLRLLPFFLENFAFRKNNELRPNVLYIHPYELDTEKYPDFYFEQLNKLNKIKQMKILTNFFNRAKSFGKLESLLKRYKFDTVSNILFESKLLLP